MRVASFRCMGEAAYPNLLGEAMPGVLLGPCFSTKSAGVLCAESSRRASGFCCMRVAPYPFARQGKVLRAMPLLRGCCRALASFFCAESLRRESGVFRCVGAGCVAGPCFSTKIAPSHEIFLALLPLLSSHLSPHLSPELSACVRRLRVLCAMTRGRCCFFLKAQS